MGGKNEKNYCTFLSYNSPECIFLRGWAYVAVVPSIPVHRILKMAQAVAAREAMTSTCRKNSSQNDATKNHTLHGSYYFAASCTPIHYPAYLCTPMHPCESLCTPVHPKFFKHNQYLLYCTYLYHIAAPTSLNASLCTLMHPHFSSAAGFKSIIRCIITSPIKLLDHIPPLTSLNAPLCTLMHPDAP